MTRALIVVDMQNDFVEGGSLAVAGGTMLSYRIANAIESLQQFGLYDYIVATKDWHMPGESNGGHFSDKPDYKSTWPPHCMMSYAGAEFVPPIEAVRSCFNSIFYKGTGRPDYSGFQGKNDDGEYLGDWLFERKVTEIDVVGIATDYCVKETAIDGVVQGFKVRIPVQLTVAVGGPEARDAAIVSVNNLQGAVDRRIN